MQRRYKTNNIMDDPTPPTPPADLVPPTPPTPTPAPPADPTPPTPPGDPKPPDDADTGNPSLDDFDGDDEGDDAEASHSDAATQNADIKFDADGNVEIGTGIGGESLTIPKDVFEAVPEGSRKDVVAYEKACLAKHQAAFNKAVNGNIKASNERFGAEFKSTVKDAIRGGRDIFGEKLFTKIWNNPHLKTDPDMLGALAARGRSLKSDTGVGDKGSGGSGDSFAARGIDPRMALFK